MAKKNWIAGAINKRGSLRATAIHDGLIKSGQSLTKSDLSKLAKSKDKKTAARARLAMTLRSFHH
jgi:hypothetical protein